MNRKYRFVVAVIVTILMLGAVISPIAMGERGGNPCDQGNSVGQ